MPCLYNAQVALAHGLMHSAFTDSLQHSAAIQALWCSCRKLEGTRAAVAITDMYRRERVWWERVWKDRMWASVGSAVML